MADNKYAASSVAGQSLFTLMNYQELQNLLFKVAENKDAASSVAYAVASNFDKLPEHVRNELLLKVAENKDAASSILGQSLVTLTNYPRTSESAF